MKNVTKLSPIMTGMSLLLLSLLYRAQKKGRIFQGVKQQVMIISLCKAFDTDHYQ